MAIITIKELYYGDKYAVMSEVFKTMFLASPNKAGVDEQTALELEIVRQTLIAVEKMKKNGDCIAEGELGNAVTVSVSEPAPIDIKDKDFGALLICAVRYCLGRQTYMPGLIIDYITPLLPRISDNTLRCMETDLSQPDLYGGFGDKTIDEPIWIKFRCDIQEEIQRRKEKSDENT